MPVAAVIVAAGEGKRMGASVAKAFVPLAGRPLILHTLQRFAACRSVSSVVLVVPKNELSRCERLISSDAEAAGLRCVFEAGGATRQESVRRGLARLDRDCDIVAIHDGARPFVSPGLIDRCVEQARKEGAAIAGIPARDTIKVVSRDGRVLQTPARDALWQIQTPQVFRAEMIREAYDRAHREGIEATDDAMLVERMGKSVAVVEGSATNLKITGPEDLLIAEALLREGMAG